MAKDIIISINAANGVIYKSAEALGINGENIEGQIIVEFFNGDFVDGAASIEIERGSDKGIIAMTKNAETKTYRLPIKSSLLSTVGEIKAQVTITQTKRGTEIPVFKSKIFTLTVGEAINATATIPEEYPTWIQTANAKIAEMDALMDDMEQKVESGYFNGKDGATGATGATGAGIDTLTATTKTPDVVTYDTTNGITIEGTETATYDNETHQSDYTDHIPLKPGDGIIIDADAGGNTVNVKIDKEKVFNLTGVTNIIFKHRVPALQAGHETLNGYFVNVNDGDATEKEIVTYRPATAGKSAPNGNGVLITNTPTQAYHAANKRYVDGFVAQDHRKGLGAETTYVRDDSNGLTVSRFIRTHGTPVVGWNGEVAGYTVRGTIIAVDPTEAQDLVTLNYFNNNVSKAVTDAINNAITTALNTEV